MKKIISVLLSLILISGSVSLAASAGKSCSCGKTPIIMVSHFAEALNTKPLRISTSVPARKSAPTVSNSKAY